MRGFDSAVRDVTQPFLVKTKATVDRRVRRHLLSPACEDQREPRTCIGLPTGVAFGTVSNFPSISTAAETLGPYQPVLQGQSYGSKMCFAANCRSIPNAAISGEHIPGSTTVDNTHASTGIFGEST